ncbi:hypothetical protein [Ruegeria sp. HKCCD7303]|uniref:hypothetical protein n=1 Tax=Ruegeria sp. HKCCD7303 TaxID=2683013 RepID=UPI001490C76B|nr:hypothetical protein [Ruegeria sp. HKCCD7303]NOD68836.1 hypothetical protein [Ruegeria sp. HKCCD7303]
MSPTFDDAVGAANKGFEINAKNETATSKFDFLVTLEPHNHRNQLTRRPSAFPKYRHLQIERSPSPFREEYLQFKGD